jgi:hypothetical protein
METTALLLILVLALWLWQASLRARELATTTCRRACSSYEVQLLDGTVSFGNLSFRRRDSGGVELVRTYQFHFSYDGTDRHSGNIVVVSRQVETIYFTPRVES